MHKAIVILRVKETPSSWTVEFITKQKTPAKKVIFAKKDQFSQSLHLLYANFVCVLYVFFS